MISIITAIYNQLDMNKLYWEYLQKYTDNPFELIIIDNNSNDGSREFFQSLPDNVKVIANSENYSYPYCQNQGIAAAKYDILAFLNNDILLSPHWDSRALQVLGKEGREVISLGSNDRIYDRKTTRSLHHKWKYVKYPCIYLFGQKKFSLNLMKRLCYGNWEKFCEKVYSKYGLSVTDGFSGSAILMTRNAVELLNGWDPTKQAADYDLYYTTCKRWEQFGDIKPIAIVNGIFIHHYRRLTLYSNFPPFTDKNNLTPLEQKWSAADVERWSKSLNEYTQTI